MIGEHERRCTNWLHREVDMDIERMRPVTEGVSVSDLGNSNAQLTYMLMFALTGEERVEIMSRFCRSCGRVQPREGRGCQCWNDE